MDQPVNDVDVFLVSQDDKPLGHEVALMAFIRKYFPHAQETFLESSYSFHEKLKLLNVDLDLQDHPSWPRLQFIEIDLRYRGQKYVEDVKDSIRFIKDKSSFIKRVVSRFDTDAVQCALLLDRVVITEECLRTQTSKVIRYCQEYRTERILKAIEKGFCAPVLARQWTNPVGNRQLDPTWMQFIYGSCDRLDMVAYLVPAFPCKEDYEPIDDVYYGAPLGQQIDTDRVSRRDTLMQNVKTVLLPHRIDDLLWENPKLATRNFQGYETVCLKHILSGSPSWMYRIDWFTTWIEVCPVCELFPTATNKKINRFYEGWRLSEDFLRRPEEWKFANERLGVVACYRFSRNNIFDTDQRSMILVPQHVHDSIRQKHQTKFLARIQIFCNNVILVLGVIKDRYHGRVLPLYRKDSLGGICYSDYVLLSNWAEKDHTEEQQRLFLQHAQIFHGIIIPFLRLFALYGGFRDDDKISSSFTRCSCGSTVTNNDDDTLGFPRATTTATVTIRPAMIVLPLACFARPSPYTSRYLCDLLSDAEEEDGNQEIDLPASRPYTAAPIMEGFKTVLLNCQVDDRSVFSVESLLAKTCDDAAFKSPDLSIYLANYLGFDAMLLAVWLRWRHVFI